MGYSITIGELSIDAAPEDGVECSCINFSAKGVAIEGSPAYGEPTDGTNQRWPSYSSWSNHLENAGLYDVFFFGGHLIGGHPGVRLVTKELLERISKAKADLESEHPNIEATMQPYTDINGTYCRVIWLEYWCKWAIENCTVPVIANS